MKVRRQGGATLGLVAACVFFVIVIGVGFYFLSKIIGGGREVANATDAGALNVAKQALKRGSYTLNAAENAEFGSLTDPPGSGAVTLVTYNRIIAQAMMVAQNASIEATPTAKTNAVTTATLAQHIGNQLKANLLSATTSPTGLPQDFNNLSQGNTSLGFNSGQNTKMWNGNPVSCSLITTGYLKGKGSTNVIFDNNSINALGAINAGQDPSLATDLTSGPSATNTPNGTDFLTSTVGAGAHYMPGYDTNTFLGGAVSLTGVPVFPNTKPHLIDIGTFNSDLATNHTFAADINTPANSFLSNAQAVEAKSNNTAGSLACAVVGVLNKDFKASFPRGFVRISNGPDAIAANGSFGIPISDGTNDIFNNQLFTGPGSAPGATGITQSTASAGVFTTNPTDLTAWANFNSRSGAYDNSAQTVPNNNVAVMTAASLTGPAWVAYGINPAGTAYPPGAFVPQGDLPTFADGNLLGGAPDSIYDSALNPGNYDNTPVPESGLRAGGNCMSPFAILGTSMSNTQLELIGMGNFNCNYTMYDDTLTGNCASVTYINNWQSNYQCTGMSTGPYLATSGQNQGVTNVEYLKAELLVKIAGRLGGHFCSDVNIPSSQPSGVKYFSRGIPGSSSGAGGSAVAFDPIYAAAGASQYVNFETVGTPYDYLSQITNGAPSCYTGSSSAILDQITARMQQIDSSVNSGLVTTALKGNSPATGTPQTLHLKGGSFSTDNGTLYMYVDPATHNVFMTPQLPVGWSDTTTGSPAQYPDGAAPAVNSGECYDQYPLNGWVVNTQNALTGDGGGAGAKGDAHYHDQPFTQPPNASGPPSFDAGGPMASSADNGTTAPIYGQDQAIFKPSSGSANILGELKFQENTQGTTFCKPN